MEIEPDEYWEDREASKKINGLFANRIFVQPLRDGMIRVNFGETLDEDPKYHTAIVITADDAVAFAQLIYRIGTAHLTPPLTTPPTEEGAKDGN